MTSTYTIRKAQTHETQQLSDLAMRSKAHWGYSEEFMQACRAEFTYSPEDIHNFYVAEINDAIAGFYALVPLSSTNIELEAMFVDPAYIGQGFGRALIEHAKAKASELGMAVIIIQSDPNAQDFYLAAGGQLTGTRESGSIPGRFLPTFEIQLQPANKIQAAL